MTRWVRTSIVVSALFLAACGGTPTATTADPDPSDQVSETAHGDGHSESMSHDAPSEEPAADDDAAYDRLVEVEMVDIAFEPSAITVKVGETVRFQFANTGEAHHEALIGDSHMQEEHEAEMASGDAGHDDGGHHGADAMATISLEPGGTGHLDFTFTEPGETLMGCHVPGHYGAGMVTTITVEA